MFGLGKDKKKKKEEEEQVQEPEQEVSHVEEEQRHEERDTDVEDELQNVDEEDKTEPIEDDKGLEVDYTKPFLRGYYDKYDFLFLDTIPDNDTYVDVRKSMYREHLYETDMVYSVEVLKEPEENQKLINGTGMKLMRFGMDFDKRNSSPLPVEENFRGAILAQLYFELFDDDPMLQKFISEAVVYTGDDYAEDENGEQIALPIAPTLAIIFKKDVDEQRIEENVAKLYCQLESFGYVISQTKPYEPEDPDDIPDFSDFDEVFGEEPIDTTDHTRQQVQDLKGPTK